MAYRQLGRTGFMVSEVVNGGDPVSTKNYRMVETAIEKGLNYLDMAPAYGRGECEKGYGLIIDSSSKREKTSSRETKWQLIKTLKDKTAVLA